MQNLILAAGAECDGEALFFRNSHGSVGPGNGPAFIEKLQMFLKAVRQILN